MLATAELRGLNLFRGRARRAECHLLAPAADGRAPFTDYAFHNTGVAFSEFAREPGLQTLRGVVTEPDKGRERVSTLTFVDAMGRRLPGLHLTLEAAGDVLPGWNEAHDAPRTFVTDERGRIVYEPPLRTHVRLGLPDGLAPLEGGLVPDTCASARIQVPVDGRLRVLIETPATTRLPTTLAAEHSGAMVLPGHPVPRTLLTSLGVLDGPPGRRIATYAGWQRTDVPSSARLLLPGVNGRLQRVKLSLAGPVATVHLK